jgi:hypothetical protein
VLIELGRTSRPAGPPIRPHRLAVSHGPTSVIQDPNQHHHATEGQPTHLVNSAAVGGRWDESWFSGIENRKWVA